MQSRKALVIFYSFEGNTKFIAQAIAEKTASDVLELIPQESIPTHGFLKYFWAGKQVFQKAKPALKSYSIDLSKYDTVFIGSPVWAFSYAPALETFFSKETIKDKNIALFCCHGGVKGSIFKKIK